MQASINAQPVPSMIELDQEAVLAVKPDRRRRRVRASRTRQPARVWRARPRSEEHTSELQSLMRNSYAVFCLKKKTQQMTHRQTHANSTQLSLYKHILKI